MTDLQKLDAVLAVQATSGNWDSSAYQTGLLNGLILARSCLTGEEPEFKTCFDAGHTIKRVAEFHRAFGIEDPTEQIIPYNPNIQPCSHGCDEAEHIAKVAMDLIELSKAVGQYAKQNNSKLMMRLHLISEEVGELALAMSTKDYVSCLDALTDIQYVLDGTYLTLGMADVKHQAFEEVHSSNMSKLGADGKPVLDGGRVVKGPNYRKPNLAQFIKF